MFFAHPPRRSGGMRAYEVAFTSQRISGIKSVKTLSTFFRNRGEVTRRVIQDDACVQLFVFSGARSSDDRPDTRAAPGSASPRQSRQRPS